MKNTQANTWKKFWSKKTLCCEKHAKFCSSNIVFKWQTHDLHFFFFLCTNIKSWSRQHLLKSLWSIPSLHPDFLSIFETISKLPHNSSHGNSVKSVYNALRIPNYIISGSAAPDFCCTHTLQQVPHFYAIYSYLKHCTISLSLVQEVWIWNEG